MNKYYCHDPNHCKIKSELDILSDKWTLKILRNFFHKKNEFSFNELKTNLKPITSKILSEKLKKLTNNEYLIKKEYKEKQQKRTTYKRTEKVKKLHKIITQLKDL